MSKVILNLSVQYTDPETLEYRSSLGKEGMFSFESLSKHYLRISSEERLEEDFDRKNLLLAVSNPIVFTYNQVMLSRFGILYQNGKSIPEVLNTYSDIDNYCDRFLPLPMTDNQLKKRYYRLRYQFTKDVRSINIRTEKTPILFFDHYFFNFTHFIAEAYPRLFWIRKNFPDHPVILPPPQNKKEYDYYQHIQPCLESLSIQMSNCIEIGHENYFFNELIVPSHIKFHPYHVPLAIKALKGYFNDEPYQCFNDKIYISREKSSLRGIGNRDEVEHILCKKYGFKKVIMEDITFEEKIIIMSSAKYLVTCDSSSITNGIFMPEGSKILAFRPFEMPNYGFFLCSLFNIKFSIQVCTFSGRDKRWYSGHLYVDPKKLIENLEAMLTEV